MWEQSNWYRLLGWSLLGLKGVENALEAGCFLPASYGDDHGKHPTPIICKEAAALLPLHVASSHPPPGKCNMIFLQSRWDASWHSPCLPEVPLGSAMIQPGSTNKAGSPVPGTQQPLSLPCHALTNKACNAKIRTILRELPSPYAWKEREKEQRKKKKRKKEGGNERRRELKTEGKKKDKKQKEQRRH